MFKFRARVLPGRRRVARLDHGALTPRVRPGHLNKRRSRLLVAGFVFVALIATLFSYLRGGVVGIVIALVIAAIASFCRLWKSDAVALRVSRARPASVEDYARYQPGRGPLHRLGCPSPGSTSSRTRRPTCLATGRNPRNGGGRHHRPAREAEPHGARGVLAHELSHIRNYDILVSTLAVTMVGVVAVLADLGIRSLWWGMGRRYSEFDRERRRRWPPGDPVGVRVRAAGAGPVRGRVMQLAVSRRRRDAGRRVGGRDDPLPAGADLGAREAARRLDGRPRHQPRHLPPVDRGAGAQTPQEGRMARINRLFDTHPPIEERIALLREM